MLAGSGGNGAGGMVAARHLANQGRSVWVTLGAPAEGLASVPSEQLAVLRRMGVPIDPAPREGDLIVDALLGYSLLGNPREQVADLIEWAIAERTPVLALDTPSGLDVTTGVPASPCMRADATVTVALPKVGLLRAAEYVGDLFLADISVPRTVYKRMGIHVPVDLFATEQVVRVPVEGSSTSMTFTSRR